MTTTTNDNPDNPLHGPNLILDVENFGPIAEAKNIEFKPMTVFVGPSNTGKSYLAILIHAVIQAVQPTSALGFGPRDFRRMVQLLNATKTQLQADLRELIKSDCHVTQIPAVPHRIPYSRLSVHAQAFLKDRFVERLNKVREAAHSNITEYFELKSFDEIAGPKTANRNPMIKLHQDLNDISIDIVNDLHQADYSKMMFSVDDDLTEILSLENTAKISEFQDRLNLELAFAVSRFTIECLPIQYNSYYFPTGRTGIMNGHRVLTSQIIANAARFAVDEREQINYHRLARDFLSLLVDVDQEADPSGQFHFTHRHLYTGKKLRTLAVADALENALIGGNIRVIRSVGLPDYEYVQQDRRVPMFRASSMVTEIAPIVMFLRNYIQIGDLLIIDEPEAHLHPAAQQQMAAALAFMVRSGLRVLITTHSHYMVEQLSAFVNASFLDPETRKRVLALKGSLGDQDIYLTEEETSVYSFELSPEKGGSVVNEIFMGDEYEYGPNDHSDATADQFNRLQSVLEARERLEVNDLD